MERWTLIWLARRAAWKGVRHTRSLSQEFRDAVVLMARSREGGITISQITSKFGIYETTLHMWTRLADVEAEARHGTVRVVYRLVRVTGWP